MSFVSDPGESWPRRLLAVAGVLVGGLALGGLLGAIGADLGIKAELGVPLVLVMLAAAVNRPVLGVALVLLAIPVGLKELPVGFVTIQAAAMLAVVATALRRLATGHGPLGWSSPLWWGMALLALALAATPRAIDATLAYKQDVDIVLGLSLVAAVLGAVHGLPQLRRLVHLLLAVAAGIGLVSLRAAAALRNTAGGQHVNNRLVGAFTQPNQFGVFCAIAVVLALGVALGGRSVLERRLGTLAAVVIAAPLVLTLSRGAWFGCVFALGVFTALVPSARRRLLLLGVPVLVALPVFGALLPQSPQVKVVQDRISTLAHPLSSPYDSRPAIWAEALREIKNSPWLGQGPGQFPVVSTEAASISATVSAAHAHNVLLTVAAEAGVPAALCLVGFTVSVGLGLRRTVRRIANPRDRTLVAAVGASLAVVVGEGLVDFVMRNAVLFLLLSVLTGLTLVAARVAAQQTAAQETVAETTLG